MNRKILKILKLDYLCTPSNYGPVVQLVRMPPCHGGGRGFESRPVRKNLHIMWGFFVLQKRRMYELVCLHLAE